MIGGTTARRLTTTKDQMPRSRLKERSAVVCDRLAY
jgi:hypothetical protein